MSECDERRVQGIKRVPVATLVEICGNQPGVPAFEGRSLDVSGRGMHVRTTYVPNVGDPLICRFENQGREIVVEGVVAWRREGDTGGDFGIEFTALDSQSVDALRALCGVAPPEPSEELAAEPEPEHLPAQPEPCGSGAKVRLHIDGLGAPMKANVHDASRRRVKVGSQLQFLKVGRHLEIEDVTLGARLSARIDAVDVRVDPRTQIPELVVALRYEHAEDATPEPSVVDQAPEASPYPEDPADPAALDDAIRDDPEEAAAREAEAEMLAEQKAADQARLAVDRLGSAAQGAAQAAKVTSRALARFGQSAAARAGTLFKGAGKQLLDLKKQEPPATKRQTAPPPAGPRTFQKLRPQGGQRPASSAAPSQAPRSAGGGGAVAAASGETATLRRRGSRVALVAGGLAVIGATAAYALRDVDGPADTAALPPLAAVAPASSVAQALPPASATPAALKPAAKPAEDPGGIVANVPLFGPTPMATMEPAPLEPELAPADEEAAEKAAAAAAVDDASWPEEAPAPAAAAAAPQVNPADVKPWGRGRMHLPTIHKLRLDAAGASVSGSINDSGFTIVVPGRKVMESGRAIQRRDERIALVKTSNTAAGAQVTFQFRGKVPAYRVRLRNDFAEFLISAPEE